MRIYHIEGFAGRKQNKTEDKRDDESWWRCYVRERTLVVRYVHQIEKAGFGSVFGKSSCCYSNIDINIQEL